MTTDEISSENLREVAVDLVRQAGALLDSRRPGEFAARARSFPSDSAADVADASARLILDGLAAQRPDDAVLSQDVQVRTGSPRVRWILNPLAGRLNYSHGLPSYGVSLAAEVDGILVAGAVHSAPLGTVHDAALGGGARTDGEPIRCTEATDLALSLVATGFSDSAERRARQGQVVGELLPDVGNLRRIGPAVIDLCAVAAGHLDAFFELDLAPWDCAAGLLVVAEAGARTGTVSTPDGEVVVAAAPGVYTQLATALRRLHGKYGNGG